jgi:hypothetical protein
MALKLNEGRDSGYEFVCDVGEYFGVHWRLYRGRTEPGKAWQKYKLAAADPVVGKANFHLSWNGERLGGGSCAMTLYKYKAKLYSLTVEALRDMGNG